MLILPPPLLYNLMVPRPDQMVGMKTHSPGPSIEIADICCGGCGWGPKCTHPSGLFWLYSPLSLKILHNVDPLHFEVLYKIHQFDGRRFTTSLKLPSFGY